MISVEIRVLICLWSVALCVQ